MSENVGASTSRNPKGLHGLYRDNFTLTSQETNNIYATRTNRLMLLKGRNTLYCENHVKNTDTFYGKNVQY
jgi:hypothetical protein